MKKILDKQTKNVYTNRAVNNFWFTPLRKARWNMKKNLTTGYLLDFYGVLLTGKQREALDMYYNMDYSLAEIAEEFGVTRQCVHRFILQGEKRLLEMENTIGHAALYRAAAEMVQAVREAENGGEAEKKHLRDATEALARYVERETNGI